MPGALDRGKFHAGSVPGPLAEANSVPGPCLVRARRLFLNPKS